MPYTPPSRSPAASAPSTPDGSRRPSLQSGASRPALPRSNNSTSNRPSLPRSSSYAQRSRRSPSASGACSPAVQPPSHDALKLVINSESVRQSPPPVTDANSMPSGAIISPPESSDDESGLVVRARLPGAQVKELQQAISQIPQQRAGSPERSARVQMPQLSPPLKDAIEKSLSSSTLDLQVVSPPRKNGHKRSVTEPNASMMMNESSVLTEEEDSDTEFRHKPQMVRKKSGELVRPALRAPSHRRPSSMPGTPTFKAVHFDSHLEHVRHFLQVDRPTAVSAGSSPVENYDSDTEYPFPGSDDRHKARQPPFEWELNARNFPAIESPARRALPVRLEKVWLSPSDQKSLIGSIVVSNLAFHKAVMCRFTFDYWKTTSEMAAEYSSPVVPKMTEAGHDRFTFSIKLSDTANLESKTLYMCIRYTVGGTEYWDNNNGANFQIDFRKKHLPQNGKGNFQGASARPMTANTLPRSNRRSNQSTQSRPKTATVTTPDEFGVKPNVKLDPKSVLGDMLDEPVPALRFKTKSMVALPSDNLSNGLSAPSGQAFAGRYDFGFSLSIIKAENAEQDAAKDRGDDGALYMKSGRRDAATRPPMPTFASSPAPMTTPVPQQKPTAAPIPPMGTRAPATLPPVPGTSSPVAGANSPMAGSNSPSFLLNNDSYDELVNKYCFFVPKQSSPTVRDVGFRSSGFDGPGHGSAAAGGARPSPFSTTQHSGPAQHNGFARAAADSRDSVSYFPAYTLKNSPISSPAAGSPSRSPHAGSGSRPQAGPSSSPRTSVAITSGPGAQLRSASPASFQSFSGASPTEEYSFHLQDRFPFSADAHAATAIRG